MKKYLFHLAFCTLIRTFAPQNEKVIISNRYQFRGSYHRSTGERDA